MKFKIISLLCLVAIFFSCISCNVPSGEVEVTTPNDSTPEEPEETMPSMSERLKEIKIGMTYYEIKQILGSPQDYDRRDRRYPQWFLEDGRKVTIRVSSEERYRKVYEIEIVDIGAEVDKLIDSLEPGMTLGELRDLLRDDFMHEVYVDMVGYKDENKWYVSFPLEDGQRIFRAYYRCKNHFEDQSHNHYFPNSSDYEVYETEILSFSEVREKVNAQMSRIAPGMTYDELSSVFCCKGYNSGSGYPHKSFVLEDGTKLIDRLKSGTPWGVLTDI